MGQVRVVKFNDQSQIELVTDSFETDHKIDGSFIISSKSSGKVFIDYKSKLELKEMAAKLLTTSPQKGSDKKPKEIPHKESEDLEQSLVDEEKDKAQPEIETDKSKIDEIEAGIKELEEKNAPTLKVRIFTLPVSIYPHYCARWTEEGSTHFFSFSKSIN